MTDQDEMVLVEVMPEHPRCSHREAKYWGVYPFNGSRRFVTTRGYATELVEQDEDKYNRIVRVARSRDAEYYGTDEP